MACSEERQQAQSLATEPSLVEWVGGGVAVQRVQDAYSDPMVPSHSPTVDLAAVTAAMAAVDPAPMRLVLFGSRARGEARPDSDIDLLVVMPQPALTPQDRQVALQALRGALRPLRLPVGVDLVVVGQDDARKLAGSRWHVVARALREGQELHDAG